ncbi:hypothetical protein MCOR25_001298 [Pyricularia grisea]|nr:hypothetical protein MCOR25_001298 [Pyricularia grisea]
MSADLNKPVETGISVHDQNATDAIASPEVEHTAETIIDVYVDEDHVILSKDHWNSYKEAYDDLETANNQFLALLSAKTALLRSLKHKVAFLEKANKELTAKSLKLQNSLDQSQSKISEFSLNESLLESVIDELCSTLRALQQPTRDSEQTNADQDVIMDSGEESSEEE